MMTSTSRRTGHEDEALDNHAEKAVDHPAELPDADPPERLSALAGEYIGLTLAGGLLAGVLIGAMLPRRNRRKSSGKLAARAGEVGLALATSALSRAGAAIREGREKAVDMGELVSETVVERASPALASAGRLIEEGAGKAREAGSTLARKAADLVGKER